MVSQPSHVPPELAFYREELSRSLAENAFAVTSYVILELDVADPGSQLGCQAQVVTLEGKELSIKLINEGYKLLSPAHAQIYDTLDSLLINHSPLYMGKVNTALTDKLNAFIGKEGETERRFQWEEDEGAEADGGAAADGKGA